MVPLKLFSQSYQVLNDKIPSCSLSISRKESSLSKSKPNASKFCYFFKGEIFATYGRFLVSLYHVHSALECAFDAHKDNISFQPLYVSVEFFSKATLKKKTL
ncbi:hypothetical protein BGZ81_001002, partial [Podila clonocystis]